MDISTLTSPQKAAMLLVALGPKKAANIFRHLEPSEIKKISFWIDQSSEINPQQADEVIKEAYKIIENNRPGTSIPLNAGRNFLQQSLSDALGIDKAEFFIKGLEAPADAYALEILMRADLEQLANFLNQEPSQTVALMLLFIDVERAKDIFCSLHLQKQNEILINFANLDIYGKEQLYNVLKAAAKALGYHGDEIRFEKEICLKTTHQIFHQLSIEAQDELMDLITTTYVDDGERIKSFFYRTIESTY